MKFDPQRTIVALSSGALPGRRAIVRISGQDTSRILRSIFVEAPDSDLLKTAVPYSQLVTCWLTWPHRTVKLRTYYWPDSRSFTGEPCAELHLVGSLPVAESLMAKLCELGAALADRGEFTLRSFLAGKIDLTQAEAVLGVIEAEGAEELQAALSQLGGNLSRPVRSLRDQLLELIAHLEAGLDFVEEDIQFISPAELTRQLRLINEQIIQLTNQIDSRDARARTAQVVLVGLPNAGKSSLFNALVGGQRVIVSSQAGTTRDVISQPISIDGLPLELVDTAGLEELQGQSPRATAQLALRQRLRHADLALLCVDATAPADRQAVQAHRQWLAEFNLAVMVVGTKADQMSNASLREDFDLLVSSQTGSGLSELRQAIVCQASEHHRAFQSEAMHLTAMRCHKSLTQARSTLQQAIELSELDSGEELIANELRLALDDLSAIIGEVHSEDILGQIFSRFCIGK